MVDLTLNDLLGKPKDDKGIGLDTNFLTSINETLKQIQEIIVRLNELKNNPTIQSYIYHRGRRLEEMGLLPKGTIGNANHYAQDLDDVKKNESEGEGNVNGDKLFEAIYGALETIKSIKGDITISELQEFLRQNREMVIKVLNERRNELS